MSICASGASQQKPGLADTVIVGSAFIASILAPELAWLEPYIAASAALVNLHLPDFCTVDPDPDPGLSATDLVAIAVLGNANPDPGPMSRLNTLIGRGVWLALCECTSGGPPTVTVPSTPPTGAPALNPPTLVTGPTGQICMTISANGVTMPSNNGAFMSQWETGALITPTNTTQQAAHLKDRQIPAGAAQVVVTATCVSQGAGPRQIDWGLVFRNAAGTNLGNVENDNTVPINANGTYTVTATVPANTVYIMLYAIQDTTGAAPTQTVNYKAEFYCGGRVNQPTSPCCPPDEIATGLLTNIYQMVTLIQRQIAPFATVHGATHSGLSGNGQFAVQGLIGIAIDVTTTPGRVGLLAGDPNQIFDVGWVTLGTADGWGPRHLISSDPFVVSPVAGDVTLVGYSIPADTVVTITELKREP